MLIAHGAAFLLIAYLPRTGIAMLGIAAADPAVLERYVGALDIPRSYPEAIARLLSLDFGRTLDGAPVAAALGTALLHTLPLLTLSLALVAGVIALTLFRPRLFSGETIRSTLEFITFLPAFLPAFLLFALAVAVGVTAVFGQSWAAVLILGGTASLSPAAMAAAIILNGFRIERGQRYVQFLRACGAGEADIDRNLRRAVFLYSVSSWEKLFTLQIAIILFTETVFSYPGFGSLLVQALQRTDVNVLLATVAGLSLAVAVIRFAGNLAFLALEPRDDAAILR